MPGPYGRWPGVELLPGRADMESAPTEGIGRKGNNNEVPRASNARPYIVLQFIKAKTPLTYTSSDKKIATIDKNGKVTVKKAG